MSLSSGTFVVVGAGVVVVVVVVVVFVVVVVVVVVLLVFDLLLEDCFASQESRARKATRSRTNFMFVGTLYHRILRLYFMVLVKKTHMFA